MATASINQIVKSLATLCETFGFAVDGTSRLKRHLSCIDQYIEIQTGSKWLAGQFTCRLGWKLTCDGAASEDVYDHAVNLGYLTRNSELWLSLATMGEAEESLAVVRTIIERFGIPFLDAHSDLAKLATGYDMAITRAESISTPTDIRLFFGSDEGWKHYNLGFLHKELGNSAKAKEHFKVVIEQHSNAPFDWVQDRRKRCDDELDL